MHMKKKKKLCGYSAYIVAFSLGVVMHFISYFKNRFSLKNLFDCMLVCDSMWISEEIWPVEFMIYKYKIIIHHSGKDWYSVCLGFFLHLLLDSAQAFCICSLAFKQKLDSAWWLAALHRLCVQVCCSESVQVTSTFCSSFEL